MIDGKDFQRIRKQIASVMYNDNVFKHICERYDKEDKGRVISDATLAIMTKVENDYGGIDLETAFAVGIIIFNNLVSDIAATGRPAMDDESQQATIRSIVIKYLMQNKGKYDPAELKQKLAELQRASTDGTIDKAFGKEPEKPTENKKPKPSLLKGGV